MIGALSIHPNQDVLPLQEVAQSNLPFILLRKFRKDLAVDNWAAWML